MAGDRLTDHERRAQVDRHHPVEVLELGVENVAGDQHAGVVDQHVDLPEQPGGADHRLARGVGVGEVAGQGVNLPAAGQSQFFRRRRHPRLVEVEQDEVAALGGEGAGAAQADTAGRAGDERRAPRKAAAHHAPVFGIETQGSAGSLRGPACNSSIEMPSGERTKAMWPSRGGRLIVTPPSANRWQVA